MKLKMPRINLDKYHIFTIFVLFLVGLGWLGLALSLLGAFYAHIIIAYISISALILIYLIFFNTAKFVIKSSFVLILILTIIAVLTFSFFTTPTIFSGRDQGSLSEAAIQLAQNHRLAFSFPAEQEFFKIYGPGKALNFPGFNYTVSGELFTQFPLSYISWLAIFYAIFGLPGFVIANSLTFIVFILSFYLLAKRYLQTSSAITAVFLILTSFVFSWFFKFTLSENLALMLTWFGIYEFILFTENKKRFYLMASIVAFSLLLFSRIETLGFFAIIIALLLIKYRDWKYLLFVIIGKKILLAFFGFLLFYIFHLSIDAQSTMTILKNLLGPFISLASGLEDYAKTDAASFFTTIFHTFKSFFVYALLDFILLGIAGFIYFWKNKKFAILIPFLIILPTFVYLIHPSISADHPWMLRRFVFTIIPASILYTVLLLDRICRKRIYFYIFTALMLLANLFVFIPYLTASPNQNLLPQIEALSHNFKSSDLILIDRDATGDGWSMMTGPLNFLYGKQAVYFFNPNDLIKIDTKKFSAVYFIIPDTKLDFYKSSAFFEKLIPLKNYSLTNSMLDIVAGEKQKIYNASVNLPKNKEVAIYGKIYLLKE